MSGNIFEFAGHIPIIDPSSFVHPNATVTGNVQIGRNVYIGPGAAIRGDWGGIVIEDGCNVQENCTIHMFPGITVVLREGAHVGHGAVVHGALLGRNCLIGMNSVIMDQAQIGEGAIVGALSFVPAEMVIPDRKIAVGNPARIVKDVSDEMLAWKSEGTALYQKLPAECHATLRVVTPLHAANPTPSIPKGHGSKEDSSREDSSAAVAPLYRSWKSKPPEES